MNVMRHGAIAPDGYVSHHERQAQAKTAAARAAADKARETAEKVLQKALLRKFQDLSEQEKNALLTKASAMLGPLLGSSRGLTMARALELLREREEPMD